MVVVALFSIVMKVDLCMYLVTGLASHLSYTEEEAPPLPRKANSATQCKLFTFTFTHSRTITAQPKATANQHHLTPMCYTEKATLAITPNDTPVYLAAGMHHACYTSTGKWLSGVRSCA